jgi:hypothetical protein
MPALLSLMWGLLRAALQHLLVAFITERLLKDVIIVALEKLSKRTDNHVDDEVCELVKRALYPDYEAGQPPNLPENAEKPSKAKK